MFGVLCFLYLGLQLGLSVFHPLQPGGILSRRRLYNPEGKPIHRRQTSNDPERIFVFEISANRSGDVFFVGFTTDGFLVRHLQDDQIL